MEQEADRGELTSQRWERKITDKQRAKEEIEKRKSSRRKKEKEVAPSNQLRGSTKSRTVLGSGSREVELRQGGGKEEKGREKGREKRKRGER